MANDDEYEIMPQSALSRVKTDIEALKTKVGSVDQKEVISSVNSLKESIDNLLNIFKVAQEEMKMEQREQQSIEHNLGPINKKLEELAKQNQELAKGLVVVADMIKEHIPKIEDEISHIKIPKMAPKPKAAPRPRPPADLPPLGPEPMPARPQAPPMPPPAAPPHDLPPLGPEPMKAQAPPGGAPPLGPLPPLEEPAEPPKKKGLLGGLFKK